MPRHPQRHAAPDPRRPRRVETHLTDAEYAELVERADRYTRQNLSAYLRNAALQRRMDPRPPAPPEVNQEAYLAFMRVGGLLNQAMHHLNSGNIWTTPQQLADFRRQLADLDAAIAEVRRLLTRVAGGLPGGHGPPGDPA